MDPQRPSTQIWMNFRRETGSISLHTIPKPRTVVATPPDKLWYSRSPDGPSGMLSIQRVHPNLLGQLVATDQLVGNRTTHLWFFWPGYRCRRPCHPPAPSCRWRMRPTTRRIPPLQRSPMLWVKPGTDRKVPEPIHQMIKIWNNMNVYVYVYIYICQKNKGWWYKSLQNPSIFTCPALNIERTT